jgi:type II pantothenate kinase
MRAGIDFGLTVTDAVTLLDGTVSRHAALVRPGAASVDVLRRALAALDAGSDAIDAIAVTGGRSRELPPHLDGTPITVVDEPTAIGRGGLALAGLTRALVVSCGTGTAMVHADSDSADFRHVTGTPVGGGTLEGLAARLLPVRRASDIATLAARGDASRVDTTLADVLGGGIGTLPPTATAVSLGRLASLEGSPAAEDLAASLMTMVAQTIALIALNAARAQDLADVVCVGRVATLAGIRPRIEAVFRVYGAAPPHFPAGAPHASAYGAAIAGA